MEYPLPTFIRAQVLRELEPKATRNRFREVWPSREAMLFVQFSVSTRLLDTVRANIWQMNTHCALEIFNGWKKSGAYAARVANQSTLHLCLTSGISTARKWAGSDHSELRLLHMLIPPPCTLHRDIPIPISASQARHRVRRITHESIRTHPPRARPA
jgi:hypothetical protein